MTSFRSHALILLLAVVWSCLVVAHVARTIQVSRSDRSVCVGPTALSERRPVALEEPHIHPPEH